MWMLPPRRHLELDQGPLHSLGCLTGLLNAAAFAGLQLQAALQKCGNFFRVESMPPMACLLLRTLLLTCTQ